MWADILQNRACFKCMRGPGVFHWSGCNDPLRTANDMLALKNKAMGLFPNSRTRQADFLRPHGIHPGTNPLSMLARAGLDIYQG